MAILFRTCGSDRGFRWTQASIHPFSRQRRCREKGFTLLELILVMVIIALALTLVAPRLPDVTGSRSEKAFRQVGLMVTAVRDRAVSMRRHYRLDLDIKGSKMEASYFGPEGLYVPDEEVMQLTLPDSVGIQDVVTAAGGKVVDGSGYIHISPKGFVEPAVIHLKADRGDVVTIEPDFLGMAVRIQDGYQELGVR